MASITRTDIATYLGKKSDGLIIPFAFSSSYQRTRAAVNSGQTAHHRGCPPPPSWAQLAGNRAALAHLPLGSLRSWSNFPLDADGPRHLDLRWRATALLPNLLSIGHPPNLPSPTREELRFLPHGVARFASHLDFGGRPRWTSSQCRPLPCSPSTNFSCKPPSVSFCPQPKPPVKPRIPPTSMATR
jgi:hypothetical protein